MDKLASNIITLIEAVIAYAYLLPVIGGLIIGVAWGIPSDAGTEFAKKHWKGVIGGTLLAAGCIYIGKWYGGKISF